MITTNQIKIGCANFGQKYGLLSNSLEISTKEIHTLLDSALDHGFNQLDTAQAYGNSETIIGKHPRAKQFSIATKIAGDVSPEEYVKSIQQSLERLKIDKVDRVLLHNAEVLDGEMQDTAFDSLSKLKDLNLVGSVGISVYDDHLLKRILKRFKIDWVQAPVNIFDRRFLASDVTELLAAQQCKLEARSVFLQGILLAPPNEIERKLSSATPAILNLFDRCKSLGVSRLAAALASIANTTSVSSIVIGIASHQNLIDIYNVLQDSSYTSVSIDDFEEVSNPAIYDPRNW